MNSDYLSYIKGTELVILNKLKTGADGRSQNRGSAECTVQFREMASLYIAYKMTL